MHKEVRLFLFVFLFIQGCLGGLILAVRRRFSPVHLLIYLVGAVPGSIGGMMLIALVARANPMTSDPGAAALHQMQLGFLAMILAFGVLGGLLAVALKERMRPKEMPETSPGLSPER